MNEVTTQTARQSGANGLASHGEVREAISSLSAADLLRLRQLAQLRSMGLPDLEWRDLLQEAFSRALSGARRWPRDVPFMAFLAQTMKSIASDAWRRKSSEAAVTSISAASMADVGDRGEAGSADLHPEREMEARDAIQRIEAIFENDPAALLLIYAIGEGQTPAEIQLQQRLTSTQYATIQRRIRRRITKAMLEKQL